MDTDLIYIAFTIIITVFIQRAYLRVNKNLLFTPITNSSITFSISICTVVSLYFSGYIAHDIFFTLLLQFFIFFVGVILTPYLILKKDLNFSSVVSSKPIDEKVTLTITCFSIFSMAVYGYSLFSGYSTGDERLLLNKSNRAFSLINSSLFNTAAPLLAFIYAEHKKRKYALLIIFFLIASTWSGSKGNLLLTCFTFIFFYFILNKNYIINKLRIKLSTKIKLSILLIFALFIPSYLMYGDNFYFIIKHRIIMAADVYIISFKVGDYKWLINRYDPILYLLHPFLAIVGVRGYDYPFGAELIGTMGKTINGTGPNSHITMLGLVFYDGSIINISIFTIAITIIYFISLLIAFKILFSKRIPAFYRVPIFYTLYSNAWSLFFDVGNFEFKLIYVIMSIIILFFISIPFQEKKIFHE